MLPQKLGQSTEDDVEKDNTTTQKKEILIKDLRTLDQEEYKNPLEWRERGKFRGLPYHQWAGIGMIALLIIIFFSSQKESELTEPQHRLLCVVLIIITLYWSMLFTRSLIGFTIGPLLVLFRVAFFMPILLSYSNNLTFLMWGNFFFTIALQRHKLDQRFLKWIVGLNCIGGTPWRARASILLAAMLLALFLNGPAVVALLTPVVLWQFGADVSTPLKDQNDERGLNGNVLATLYGALAGGMGTLLSPQVIICVAALKRVGIDVGFLEWLCIGLPMALFISLATFGVLHCTLPPSNGVRGQDGTDHTTASSSEFLSGPWKWGEKITFCFLCITLVLWLFPNFYDLVDATDSDEVTAALPVGTVVIFAALPLFLIPDKNEKQEQLPETVLPWTDVLTGIDWGRIIHVGGGLSLGTQMTATGLADVIAQDFVTDTGINNIWVFTFFTIIFTMFLSELLPNIFSLAVLSPIVYAIGARIDADPNVAMVPVVAMPFAAVCSFISPWPLNAIAFETGHLTTTQLLKFGFLMNAVSVVVIFVVCIIIVPGIWPQSY